MDPPVSLPPPLIPSLPFQSHHLPLPHLLFCLSRSLPASVKASLTSLQPTTARTLHQSSWSFSEKFHPNAYPYTISTFGLDLISHIHCISVLVLYQECFSHFFHPQSSERWWPRTETRWTWRPWVRPGKHREIQKQVCLYLFFLPQVASLDPPRFDGEGKSISCSLLWPTWT